MDLAHFWNTSGAYQINQSLRFNSADSAYLNRTPASAGNRKTWTFSCWAKRGKNNNYYTFGMSANSSGTDYAAAGIWGYSTEQDTIILGLDPNSATAKLRTSAVYRDYSGWYHIVIAWDTTQATASNRIKLYVNGIQQTALGVANYPSQNFDGLINNTHVHYIGKAWSGDATNDGYLAEVNFIDGTALTPSSFGETDTITGAWIPKKYSGSYGTNGFYLKFDPSATNGIGHDHSGNGNNFTATGFSTSGTGTDVMSDTPTNNYPTWNALARGDDPAVSMGVDLSDGNLVAAMNRDVADAAWVANFAVPTSGKWYWEVEQLTAGSPNPFITTGIIAYPWTWNSSDHVKYDSRGRIGKDWNGVTYQSVSAWGAGFGSSSDVCGIAINADNNTVQFYKNGVAQGTTESYSGSTYTYVPHCTTAANTAQNVRYNFGQRAFAYTPPTGFKALNTANLPEPTIKKGSAHFNTVLYTGDSAASHAITGVGFQPDFLWIKRRNGAQDHQAFDAVRGADKSLQQNATNAESDNDTQSSFDADGFTLTGAGVATNSSGGTFVAWNWKANGAGSSNTAGTITSTVSANATAGFSIVTYTGNATAGATIGHGLGVAPKMVIAKPRSASGNWVVYHESIGNTGALTLQTTDGTTTNIGYWNNTSPTSTVFSLGSTSDANQSGVTAVAYCFSEVAGYSKFGSYTGNGSSDGPFVFCNFRPAWIMIKDSTGSGNSWYISDNKRNTYNVVNGRLMANLSNDESTSVSICDFTSNGFKIRTSDSGWNTSSSTYIFAAFSETAFKFANAR